jgi:predicted secreted Zn-dependent protease
MQCGAHLAGIRRSPDDGQAAVLEAFDLQTTMAHESDDAVGWKPVDRIKRYAMSSKSRPYLVYRVSPRQPAVGPGKFRVLARTWRGLPLRAAGRVANREGCHHGAHGSQDQGCTQPPSSHSPLRLRHQWVEGER